MLQNLALSVLQHDFKSTWVYLERKIPYTVYNDNTFTTINVINIMLVRDRQYFSYIMTKRLQNLLVNTIISPWSKTFCLFFIQGIFT